MCLTAWVFKCFLIDSTARAYGRQCMVTQIRRRFQCHRLGKASGRERSSIQMLVGAFPLPVATSGSTCQWAAHQKLWPTVYAVYQLAMGCLRTWQGATSFVESQIIPSPKNCLLRPTDLIFFQSSWNIWDFGSDLKCMFYSTKPTSTLTFSC